MAKKFDMKIILIAAVLVGVIFFLSGTRDISDLRNVQLSVLSVMQTTFSAITFDDYVEVQANPDITKYDTRAEIQVGDYALTTFYGDCKSRINTPPTYQCSDMSEPLKNWMVRNPKSIAYWSTGDANDCINLVNEFRVHGLDISIIGGCDGGAAQIATYEQIKVPEWFTSAYLSQETLHTINPCFTETYRALDKNPEESAWVIPISKGGTNVLNTYIDKNDPTRILATMNGKPFCGILSENKGQNGIRGSVETGGRDVYLKTTWFARPPFPCTTALNEVIAYTKFTTGQTISSSALPYTPRFCLEYAPIQVNMDGSSGGNPALIQKIVSGENYIVPATVKSIDVLYITNCAAQGICCAEGQKYNTNTKQCVSGLVDTADVDVDADNVPNLEDNAPYVANPAQKDTDNDGIGDVVDPRPTTPTTELAGSQQSPDANVSAPTAASSNAIAVITGSTPSAYQNLVKPTPKMTDAQMVAQQIKAGELGNINQKILRYLKIGTWIVWGLVVALFLFWNTASISLFAQRNIEGFVLGGLAGVAFGIYLGFGIAWIPALFIAGFGTLVDALYLPKR